MNNKVLIIEDDPFVQRFYKRLFESSDHVAEVAGSGEEGFEKAKTMLPNLILLDIMMPGLNGIQVLEMIKKEDLLRNIPVVMLTVLSDTETVKKATALGASGFLIKSEIDPKELTKQVDNFLINKNG